MFETYFRFLAIFEIKKNESEINIRTVAHFDLLGKSLYVTLSAFGINLYRSNRLITTTSVMHSFLLNDTFLNELYHAF